jgi:glucan phosphoethanolaminetransferase (alkaline phosphatase superfamily)
MLLFEKCCVAIFLVFLLSNCIFNFIEILTATQGSHLSRFKLTQQLVQYVHSLRLLYFGYLLIFFAIFCVCLIRSKTFNRII